MLGIFLFESRDTTLLHTIKAFMIVRRTKLDDLVGESFIPSHRCITVRDHVYLWMTLASFTLTLFSTILFRLIHCMNRWSSKIESDSGHVCARFLRLGLVVPALLMTPFVIYIFTLEIEEGTQVEAFVCGDCVKSSSMFNRSACFDSKCVPSNAVGPRNASYMGDDVYFVGTLCSSARVGLWRSLETVCYCISHSLTSLHPIITNVVRITLKYRRIL